MGLTRSLDAEVAWYGLDDRRDRLTASASYQILPSMEDTSPGLAVGVLDFAGVTRRGRAVFAAITYRMFNTGATNEGTSTDLTMGLWSFDRGLVFVGTKLPLSDSFWLVGEHDGRDLNWGAHMVVSPRSAIRLLFMRGQPTVGLRLSSAS